MTKVLFVCWEPIGERMAGPPIRCLELARTVARAGCEVTIAAPDSSFDDPSVTLIDAGAEDYERLLRAARDHDVVVAERLSPHLLHTLSGLRTRYVADLYNPIVVESAERNRRNPRGRSRPSPPPARRCSMTRPRWAPPAKRSRGSPRPTAGTASPPRWSTTATTSRIARGRASGGG